MLWGVEVREEEEEEEEDEEDEEDEEEEEEEEEEDVKHRGLGGWGPQDLPKPYKYQCFGSLEVENTIFELYFWFLGFEIQEAHIFEWFCFFFLVLQGLEIQTGGPSYQPEPPDLAKPKKTTKPTSSYPHQLLQRKL